LNSGGRRNRSTAADVWLESAIVPDPAAAPAKMRAGDVSASKAR